MNSSHENCATPSTQWSSAVLEDFVSRKVKTFVTPVTHQCREEHKKKKVGEAKVLSPIPTWNDGWSSLLCLQSGLHIGRFQWETPQHLSGGIIESRRDRRCGQRVGCF